MNTVKNNKDVLFTIDGFQVVNNATYLIVDKKDADAPTGFVDAGVSKLPSDGVDESFGVRYVRTTGTKGIWDTGFYDYSPCHADLSDAERKIVVKALVDNVLKPYKKTTGDEEAFDQKNNKFFDELRFKVSSGKVFNTSDPISRMELYFAIRAYQVAPKGSEGDSKYREASYVLYDTAKNVKQKDEKNLLFFEAVGVFTKLWENSPEKLITILTWLGFKLAKNPDKGTLVSIFTDYLQGSYDKTKAFLDIVEESDTTLGFDKLAIFRKLKEVHTKSTKIRKSPSGVYFYDDVEVGGDLKASAENIAKNKDLAAVKRAILIEEE